MNVCATVYLDRSGGWQTKPGLSSYENDPQAGAQSLKPLLQKAQDVVPQQFLANTPVRLGATAGLRQLPASAAEAILDAVRNLFKNESKLSYKADWVSTLQGTDEGAYQWVTVNYLLGTLGKKYSSTVGVVDLGGAQTNLQQMHLKIRMMPMSWTNLSSPQSLNLSGDTGNPCVTNSYQGTHEYLGVVYKVSAHLSGTSMRRCRALIRKTLRVDAPCNHTKCSFDGVWSGGGGLGLKNLYVASYFYDTAAETGLVEADAPSGRIRPIDYKNAAKRACSATVDNIKSIFPLIDERDVPFLCLDLIYEYTMLVNGFGVNRLKEITVVKQLEYKKDSSLPLLEAAWPLGCAVELVSSLVN
ncbi:hypothetical protein ACP275_02G098400 [Erythranthe tilingii]